MSNSFNFDEVFKQQTQHIRSKKLLVVINNRYKVLTGEQYEGKPICESANINIRLLDYQALKNTGLTSFPKYQDLLNRHKNVLGTFNNFDYTISISHRWKESKGDNNDNPDPDGSDFTYVMSLVSQEIIERKVQGRVGLFFDYSCFPQKPRDNHDQTLFSQLLPNVHFVYMMSDLVISVFGGDYQDRSWCVFEMYLSYMMGNNQNQESLKPILKVIDQSIKEVPNQVNKMFDGTNCTNRQDVGIIKDLMKSILCFNQSYSLQQSFRNEVPIRSTIEHEGLFKVNKITGSIKYKEGDLSEFHINEMTQILRKFPCLLKLISNCIVQRLKRIIMGYSNHRVKIGPISEGRWVIRIPVRIIYDHHRYIQITPSNICNETELCIRMRYGSLHNLLDEVMYSKKIDTTVFRYLILTNSVNPQTTKEYDHYTIIGDQMIENNLK